MISRIYVVPNKGSMRADSYLIDSKLSKEEVTKLAKALTNPILETYYINESQKLGSFSRPKGGQAYAVEIGYLPGVTDNIGHTVKEIATDLLRLKKDFDFRVYTSKIFLISGKKNTEEVKKFASTLYNPLIEKAEIAEVKNGKLNLPNIVPEVILKKSIPVINVPLEVSNEELIKIGAEGILGEDKKRRGPLALGLLEMQAIKAYFAKLKRDPTDIELESLAQTWSEHCKHTIFANPIDDVKDGLYKTYIKGATNLIRKQKGKADFCVSVFSDNAGGIIFDEDYLITHKVETHNSPSALYPFCGAITGIVGVNRDAIGFGLGAKPVANTYGFCLSEPEDKRELFRDKNLKEDRKSVV